MKDGKRRRAKVLRLPDTAAFEQAASVPVKGQKPLTKGDGTDLKEVRRHLGRVCREGGVENGYGGVFHTYVVREPRKLLHATVTLWHGTPLRNLPGILGRGIEPSHMGLLGPGVYFGGREKAESYFKSPLGALLQCEVALGRVYDAIGDFDPRWDAASRGYDSIHGVVGKTVTHGGTLRREEWAVLDPARISIRAIKIFAAERGQCPGCGIFASSENLRSRWSPSQRDYIRVCTRCWP